MTETELCLTCPLAECELVLNPRLVRCSLMKDPVEECIRKFLMDEHGKVWRAAMMIARALMSDNVYCET